MEALFALLNAIAQMSPELEAHLRSILQHTYFKEGDFILRTDKINRSIYFIESGLVRIYHDLSGKEVTTWFLVERDIFISVRSFFRQLPSREDIVALEDCCWRRRAWNGYRMQ